MKASFFSWCKWIVAVVSAMDLLSLIFFAECLAGGHNVWITAYLFLQVIVFTGALILWFTSIKPCSERIAQACLDFEKGKTLKLEIQPEDLKKVQELDQLTKKINEVISRKDRLLLSHKEAEYLALQNQINPHFLYNTLEAIRGDALIAGLSSLAGTAEALASFFRYTISGENLLSTVEDELINIRNYFLIQRYRFGDSLKLEIHFIDDEAEIRKLQIPKLTLQPIVENCVFHGLETKRNKGTIRISFDQTQKFLFISVKDDGIGMSENELKRLNESLMESPFRIDKEMCGTDGYVKESGKKSSGIALKNVSQRIKLLFGNEYGITVYSFPDVGTNVKIVLPGQAFVKSSQGERENHEKRIDTFS